MLVPSLDLIEHLLLAKSTSYLVNKWRLSLEAIIQGDANLVITKEVAEVAVDSEVVVKCSHVKNSNVDGVTK